MALKLSGKWYAVLVLAALAAVLVLALPGIADAAKKPKVDSAKGSGVDSEGGKFSFNARSTDTDPLIPYEGRGRFSYTDKNEGSKGEPLSIEAKVKCLWVEGERATIQAKVKRSNVIERDRVVVLSVRDSGEPEGSGDEFLYFEDAEPSAQCPPPTPVFSIESGNIAIHDAVAPE